MSFVFALPEELTAIADNLRSIGATLAAQGVTAAPPTTGVVPAAADEVSLLMAAQFAAHAQAYQAISERAIAVHERFVNTLATSAEAYATTDAANVISVH